MASSETEQIGLPFYLYDYDHSGVPGKVNEHIESGQLPFDTFFRLAALGRATEEGEHNRSILLNWILMADMATNVKHPKRMRPETREVLWGELPDAIVDPNSYHNEAAYSKLDPVYYHMGNLMGAIHRRRVANGQALPERPFDRRLHVTQDEGSRCQAIARPLWRLMVRRFHPEWLETPEDVYPSSRIGPFCVVYTISEKQMKRGIVSHAVLSDPLVSSIYQEAITTGVKGIGRVGVEDLRLLLVDEHPELLDGHELPKTT